MTACIEAGIQGKVLMEKLAAMGLTMGHEPDSGEFSTLGTTVSCLSLTLRGGWISTRASGMKKNKYGNMEDLIVSARVVTPVGTLSRDTLVPRISSGPDINHVSMILLSSN